MNHLLLNGLSIWLDCFIFDAHLKQQSFLVGPSLAIVLINVRMAAAVCSASTIGKKAVKKDNLHRGGTPVHQTQDPIIQNVGYI